jgi:hypothetical protein
MWIQTRETSADIRLHPYPPQEEIDQGIWVTGKEGLKTYCRASQPTVDMQERRAQSYAIADEIIAEEAKMKTPLVKVKVAKGKSITLHYREILTPALIDPIAKLRVRPGKSTSGKPQYDIQKKILQRVLDRVYAWGKLNKDQIKGCIEEVVGKRVDQKRDNLKRGLTGMYPSDRKAINEILRNEKPVLADKEIDDFQQQIIYHQRPPFDVFVERFHMNRQQKVKIPQWVLTGLEVYLSGETEDKTIEELLIEVLSQFLHKADLPKGEITSHIKDQLRKQWRL